MDRATAEKLMSIYKRLGMILNEVDSVITTLPEDERKAHARGLGGMMADLWINLQSPIVREHPELDEKTGC
jgi:hypothetical protein